MIKPKYIKKDSLYHTTSLANFNKIIKTKKLMPLTSDKFISFSKVPYTGDISGNDISIGLSKLYLKDYLIEVKYTDQWYKKFPDHASYIAGEGWIEQYDRYAYIDPDQIEFDPETEEEYIPPDVEDYAYVLAELDAFKAKSDEQEWISKYKGKSILLDVNAIKNILVYNPLIYEKVLKIIGDNISPDMVIKVNK